MNTEEKQKNILVKHNDLLCTLMPWFPWTLMLIGAHGDAQTFCGTKGEIEMDYSQGKKIDSS